MNAERPTTDEPLHNLDKSAANRHRPLIRVITVFFVIGVLWLVYWFLFMRPLETTDDAYIVGNQIRISSQTSGTVKEILVDNTQMVEAGQVLLRLDPTDAALTLEKSRNNLGDAVRQIASMMAKKDLLAAQIIAREKELEINRNDYERRLKLKPGSSVTAEEIERFQNLTQVAEANLEAARAELASTNRLLGSIPPTEHPQIKLQASQVREAWLALKRCEIKSPVSGKVARRTVQLGAQVKPETALLTVVPTDEVWVEANFKESQLSRFYPGLKARVKVDMYGGTPIYEGTVIGLNAGTGGVFSLLPPENATGNWIKIIQRIPVRIAINSEEIKHNTLILGLSCHVEVLLFDPPNALPEKIQPLYQTNTLTFDMTDIDREIEEIIILNMGEALKAESTEHLPN